jgi:hypothetical protein
MPIVELPKQRHHMQEEGASLKITIPSRKNYFIIFFLGFWLTFWAFGEIMALGIVFGGILQLLFNTSGVLPEIGAGGLAGLLGGGVFMLVWLSGWTVGGGFVFYTFLWQLTGKENIEISHDIIKIQNAIFRFGRTKEYAAKHIKDLRVSPAVVDNFHPFGWSRASFVWGRPNGLLAFDYGAKTFRFGGGIDEAEAKQILEKIAGRFPQFRTRNREAG